MDVDGQRHASADLSPGKIPGTRYIGDWLGPTEILAFTGLRTPDRTALSESLYSAHWHC